jgi:hypothetical protein
LNKVAVSAITSKFSGAPTPAIFIPYSDQKFHDIKKCKTQYAASGHFRAELQIGHDKYKIFQPWKN